MKKSFKQSVCKALSTIACAGFIFAGMTLLGSISAKAANIPYSIDLTNGRTISCNFREQPQAVQNGKTVSYIYSKDYKDAYMLFEIIEAYSNNDEFKELSVLSQNPYQAISASLSNSKLNFSAAKGSVGSGRYVLSKDTIVESMFRDKKYPENWRPIFEKSAKERVKEYERIITGTEGTGDSVFVVTIGYSSLPLLTDNNANGTRTAAFIVGSEFDASGIRYRINNANGSLSALYLTKTAKTVTVPDSIVYSGYTLNVTDVAQFFVRGNKKVKNVTIGKNVKTIGKQAFWNCANLKKVKIKSEQITSFGRKAFGKDASDFYVKLPKKCKKNYEKLFNKANLKSVKVK